jgi:hypothetical protein
LGITRRSHARPGRPGELAAGGSQAGVWSLQKGGIRNGERQNWPKTHRQRTQAPESAVLGNLQAAFGGGPGEKGWQQYLACGLSYFLLGFVGSKEEAEEIKQRLNAFLKEELKLDLSEAKTLITHARTETARFLNYEIHTLQEDSHRDRRDRRTLNGGIGLRVPEEVIKNKCQRYKLHSRKVLHRTELINDSDFSIIALYQAEYRGLVEYYRLAYNLHRLTTLEGVMEQSLTKTLATKQKVSVPKVYRKYQTTVRVEKKCFKVLQTTIEREGKKPLVAQWGGISLHWDIKAPLKDHQMFLGPGRSELEKRLLADICEYCGTTGDAERIEVHHIRALKDLATYDGREKPAWVKIMAARKRKTLVLCATCHQDVTYGRPMRRKPKSSSRKR